MPDSDTTRDNLCLRRAIPRRDRASGINIDDLTALEAKTRRRGTLLLGLGLGLFGLTVAAVQRIIALDPHPFNAEPARFAFALLNLIAAIALAAVLTGMGITEKIGQPERAINRQTARIAPENAERLDRITVALEGLLKREAVRNELLAKIEGVIEKVPQYPEAVQDGWDLARGVAGSEGHF